MSTSPASEATGVAASPSGSPTGPTNEDKLRKQLRSAMQKLKSREPLDPTYKRLLMNGVVTPRRPILPKDKMYKRVGSRLRERVETFLQQTEGKDPFDRISQRQPLEEDAMRAALTLREAKEHEQESLLAATLSAFPRRNGMDEITRKRYLEGIALGLQSRTTNKISASSSRAKSPPPSVAEKTELARQQAELERERKQTRVREAARRKREEEERQRREAEIKRKRKIETPQQALHKLYQPVFKKLWDMEFPHLGGTNPFRIEINRDNCASVGAPDYFDVIKTPMNLTYIKRKVDGMTYESLGSFFADVDLMLNNAMLYNSDPSNPYRVAAEEMKKRCMKMAKKVMRMVKQQQKS